MRFESIHVSRYGCLADLATGLAPLPPIVVVLCPNESGKSTFFDFLTTLLSGFRPASRDRHPFTPWTGGNPEGWARLRMDDDTVQEIHRRLLSTGRSRLTVEGRVENIANQAVPGTEHVRRVVFRQVYALTLSELAGLERESWDLVQDRLVGAMAAPDLRSARVVAAELEAEAARLWRPDRRGRPRDRMLQGELRELNDRLRDAIERDRMLREKVAELAAAEAKLRALREERVRDRNRRGVMEDRLNRLLPVRRALKRIEELRSRGLYDAIWQAFCVLLPVQSVGVAGDVRGYGSVVAIRASTSEDGMTADVYPMAADDLLEISSRITNAVPEVGRVVYDVSSKPPATIEWE